MRIVILFLSAAILSCTESVIGPEESEKVQPANNRTYFDCVMGGIESAREEIQITMYLMKFTPGREDSVHLLLDRLVEARRRGIDVHVLLENSLDENFSAADYLLSRGVSVRFDPAGITTHAKFVLIDSLFLILGSSNWTTHAIRHNNETNLLITDSRVGELYKALFEELWTSSERAAGSPPLFPQP